MEEIAKKKINRFDLIKIKNYNVKQFRNKMKSKLLSRKLYPVYSMVHKIASVYTLACST